MNEINGLLQKSNQSLEQMEVVGEKLEAVYAALQRFAVATKKQTVRLLRQLSRRSGLDDGPVIKGEVVTPPPPAPKPAEPAPVSE